MAVTPKLKPNLLIQNNTHELSFKTTSALVLNSLFRHHSSQLVVAPELTLKPTPFLQPAEKIEEKQKPREAAKPNNFFDPRPIAKGAEGIGDLFTALASGDFLENPSLSTHSNEGQANPATLFFLNKKQAPSPLHPKQKDREQELEHSSRRTPTRTL